MLGYFNLLFLSLLIADASFASSRSTVKTCLDVADDARPFSELKPVVLARMNLQQESAQRTLASLPSDAKKEFSVVTVNAGLMKTWFTNVPEYDLRLTHLDLIVGAVLKNKPNFVTWQEVWKPEDQEKIAAIAQKLGYTAAIPKVLKGQMLGLMTLIRSDLMIDAQNAKVELIDLPAAKASIWDGRILGSVMLAEFRRGVLRWSGTVMGPQGKPLRVELLNTHLTAGYNNNAQRNTQAALTRALMRELGQTSDLVVFGGDLNSSDVFNKLPPGQSTSSMMANGIAGQRLFTDGNILDSWAVLHPNLPGYTQDLAHNLIAAQSPTMKSEANGRFDYTGMGTYADTGIVVAAATSNLILTGPLTQSDGTPITNSKGLQFSASDHFGVASTYTVGVW